MGTDDLSCDFAARYELRGAIAVNALFAPSGIRREMDRVSDNDKTAPTPYARLTIWAELRLNSLVHRRSHPGFPTDIPNFYGVGERILDRAVDQILLHQVGKEVLPSVWMLEPSDD